METPKPKPITKSLETKSIFISTTQGRMVDLTTGIEYTQAPKEVVRVNGWLQSQIDAGKMKLA